MNKTDEKYYFSHTEPKDPKTYHETEHAHPSTVVKKVLDPKEYHEIHGMISTDKKDTESNMMQKMSS